MQAHLLTLTAIRLLEVSVSRGLNESEWSRVYRIHNIRFHGRAGRGVADASAGPQIAISEHGSR